MATQGTQLAAAMNKSAFAAIPDRAFLRITGLDATRWLNGMVTNSVHALAPGQGNYNFLLNAQGRIQGDCTIYRENTMGEPTFLLATDATQRTSIGEHLDKFIIMDDVELTPAFENEPSLLLLGPESPKLLASLSLPALDPLRLAHADTPKGAVLLMTPPQALRFELRAPAAILTALRKRLEDGGVQELTPESLEQLRVLQALPRYGTDIRDRELPQETGQGHALHFSKGCYLGQEIVERIHSRGQVNRLFTPLRLEGTLPALPVLLELNGKSVGEITSAAWVDLPSGPHLLAPHLLALGYVRRDVPLSAANPEATSPRAPLTYPGGIATARMGVEP